MLLPTPRQVPVAEPQAGWQRRDPVVLPFFHTGMGRVLPKTKQVPRWGNEISITVGQPLDLADQLAACRAAQDREARTAVRSSFCRMPAGCRLLPRGPRASRGHGSDAQAYWG